MICELCEKRGKTWDGDDPRCAFQPEQFSTANWNCATLNTLRDIAEKEQRDDRIFRTYHLRHCDHSFAALPFTDRNGVERFIALSWYKSRGRTGQAWVFTEDDPPVPLTYEAAMDCIQNYQKKPNARVQRVAAEPGAMEENI